MKLTEKMGRQIGRMGAEGREAPLEGECLTVKRGLQGREGQVPHVQYSPLGTDLATRARPFHVHWAFRPEAPCLFVMPPDKFDMTKKMVTAKIFLVFCLGPWHKEITVEVTGWAEGPKGKSSWLPLPSKA